MTLSVCQSELYDRLEEVSFPASPRTPLFCLAHEFHELAVCYRKDGDHFLDSGDPVNALASWSYALGWLDAGISLGILTTTPCLGRWVFQPVEFADEYREPLREKVHRYERLLSAAIDSAGTGPEEETVMGQSSLRFRSIASLFLDWGRIFLDQGRAQNALASFSYGHAWMDAGIRSGLFFVKGSRDLFAL